MQTRGSVTQALAKASQVSQVRAVGTSQVTARQTLTEQLLNNLANRPSYSYSSHSNYQNDWSAELEELNNSRIAH